jgi:hypothetical protein
MLLAKHIDVCFDFTTICFVTTRRLNLTTESKIPSSFKDIREGSRHTAVSRRISKLTESGRVTVSVQSRPTSPRSDHFLSLLRRGLSM